MARIVVIAILASLFSACNGEKVTVFDRAQGPHEESGQRPSNQVIEGTINGGGGKGVRCHVGAKTTVEFLDLYEAKAIYSLKLQDIPDKEEAALTFLAETFAKHFFNPTVSYTIEQHAEIMRKAIIADVIKSMKFINKNQKLKFVNDSFEPILEENCEPVQVGVYYDESILLVDPSLWDQMSWASRIAFIAHEVAYMMERKSGATNSISVRKFVAHMFSTKGVQPIFDGIQRDSGHDTTCTILLNNNIVGVAYAFNKTLSSGYNSGKRGLEIGPIFLSPLSAIFRNSVFLNDRNLESLSAPTDWSSQSDIFVDTYSRGKNSTDPSRTYFKYLAEGQKLSMRIQISPAGTLSEEYDFHCDYPLEKK